MVHAATDDQARFTGVPLLCVEVTSGNWTSDLILKRAKYAAARLHDYWVVDRRERVLRQYVLQGDLWWRPGTSTATEWRRRDSPVAPSASTWMSSFRRHSFGLRSG